MGMMKAYCANSSSSKSSRTVHHIFYSSELNSTSESAEVVRACVCACMCAALSTLNETKWYKALKSNVQRWTFVARLKNKLTHFSINFEDFIYTCFVVENMIHKNELKPTEKRLVMKKRKKNDLNATLLCEDKLN